ncbi:MAG: hypothetical protein ACR2MN_09550 [Acidimicrobiales bacterium]
MGVDDVLRSRGWNVAETAKLPEEALDKNHQSTLAASNADSEFLDRYAGVPRATSADRAVLAVEHAIRRLSEVEASLRSEDVAKLLGVSVSRVSHRYKEGSLYGFKTGGQILFPGWQFHHAETIPHLAAVVAALDPDAPAVLVRRFMEHPTNSVGIDEAMSPRDWLLAGGASAPVLEIAPHLGDQV